MLRWKREASCFYTHLYSRPGHSHINAGENSTVYLTSLSSSGTYYHRRK